MSYHDLSYFKDINVPFGEYIFLVNGRPVYASNKVVRIEIGSNYDVRFFYYSVTNTENTTGKSMLGGHQLTENVKRIMDSKVLFGFDFNGWFSPSLLSSTLGARVRAYPELRILSYETQPYFALRTVSKEVNSGRSLKNDSTGEVMDTITLRGLINQLRINGFESYIYLHREKIHGRAVYARNLRRMHNIYTLAHYYIDGLYHPLADDPELSVAFGELEIGKAIRAKMEEGTRGSSYSFLTVYELSQLFNIGGESRPTLLHLKYHMVMTILMTHFLYDLPPQFYPIRGETIWLKTDASDLGNEYPKILKDSEFDKFRGEVVVGDDYVSWDSYNFYWTNARNYFSNHGLGDNVINHGDYLDAVANIKVV